MNGEQIRNGLHNFLKPPNASQVVLLVVYLASLFIGYGAFSEKFASYFEKQKDLEIEVAKINEGGTNFSKQAIALQHETIGAHEARLQKTEEAIRNDGVAIGKLDVVNEKIDRLRDDVKELKSRK